MRLPVDKEVAVFAHDIDDDRGHSFLFKLVDCRQLERVCLALQEEGVWQDFGIEERREPVRMGYAGRGWRVWPEGMELWDGRTLSGRRAVRLRDVERMFQEMFFAQGVELRLLSYRRIINLKIEY